DELARDAFEARDPAGDFVAALQREGVEKRDCFRRADDITGAGEHRFEAAPEWSEIGWLRHGCGVKFTRALALPGLISPPRLTAQRFSPRNAGIETAPILLLGLAAPAPRRHSRAPCRVWTNAIKPSSSASALMCCSMRFSSSRRSSR